jgi:hypothetical protein
VKQPFFVRLGPSDQNSVTPSHFYINATAFSREMRPNSRASAGGGKGAARRRSIEGPLANAPRGRGGARFPRRARRQRRRRCSAFGRGIVCERRARCGQISDFADTFNEKSRPRRQRLYAYAWISWTAEAPDVRAQLIAFVASRRRARARKREWPILILDPLENEIRCRGCRGSGPSRSLISNTIYSSRSIAIGSISPACRAGQ